jgi:hypothetical protein
MIFRNTRTVVFELSYNFVSVQAVSVCNLKYILNKYNI